MKAHARSLRIAPKKANLIAQLVRGMAVADALALLKRTHKKGARMVERLLESAVANAQHNDKQDASSLVIRTIVVNQGTAYRRGVPMARGRMRPMHKFLSHISVTLGLQGEEGKAQKKPKKGVAEASQKAPRSVKSASSTKGIKGARSSDSSSSSAA